MPKKKPESKETDHLSSALESLRQRPNPQVGLESHETIVTLSYVAAVGAVSLESSGSARSVKKRMGFSLREDLCERIRNAVWHLADRIGLNLSSMAEGVLAAEVERLEATYNGGKPFPKRQGRLRGGVARRRPRELVSD